MQTQDTSNPDELPWQVSSHCNGGTCVRVAHAGSYVVLGDAKDPGGVTFSYSRSTWTQIIKEIKAGRFDHV